MAKARRQTTEQTDTNTSNINSILNPQQSLTTNGYIKLPGGLILQWGTFAGGQAAPTINLPIPFPTAILNASASAIADNGAIAVTSVSTTQLSFTQLDAAANTNTSSAFYWMAIGY